MLSRGANMNIYNSFKVRPNRETEESICQKIVDRTLERLSLTEASLAQTLAAEYERSGCRSRSKTPPRLTKQFSTQVHHSTERRENTPIRARERYVEEGDQTATTTTVREMTMTTTTRRRRTSLRPAKYSLVALKISGSDGELALRTIHPPLSKGDSPRVIRKRSDEERHD